MALRRIPMTWDIFKKDFLDRFFLRELRYSKVEEFINLRQGGMSLLEYSLKFTKFSKYAPSLLSDSKDEMSCFLTGVSEDFVEEYHLAMLHDNTNISRIMVNAQQVEETRLRRKNREAKRVKSYDGGALMRRLEIQDNPRFKKILSNQVPSISPKARDDWVSNPKSQKGRGTSSPTCGKCGKKNYAE